MIKIPKAITIPCQPRSKRKTSMRAERRAVKAIIAILEEIPTDSQQRILTAVQILLCL